MEKSRNKTFNYFKGTGFILGYAIAIVAAIAIFILSENFIVSLSASVPIGTSLGVVFEQRFRGEERIISPGFARTLVGLLSIGIILFLAILLITLV